MTTMKRKARYSITLKALKRKAIMNSSSLYKLYIHIILYRHVNTMQKLCKSTILVVNWVYVCVCNPPLPETSTTLKIRENTARLKQRP